jgi:5-methylcytosine-specific restriction protein A
MKEIVFFRKQRNRTIRNQCAERDNYTCQVCGFNFEEVYGDRGKCFIEVHHLKTLASYDEEHDVKLNELISLCSNCHSMIHIGGKLITPKELTEIIKKM